MLTRSDKFHLGAIWTLDSSAILVNLLLIAAITFRTPTPLRTYSIFLLNNALIDLTTAAASMMGSVRIIENHEETSSIGIFLGPCSLISRDLCRVCQGLHVYLVQHSTVVLLLSFAYRLYIISDIFVTRPPPTRPVVWLFCSLPLLLTLTLIIGYYYNLTIVPDEVLDKFKLHGYTTMYFSMFSRQAMPQTIAGTVISPFGMILIFIVRRKLIARISQTSTVDRRTHESIAKALTYQMMLPLGGAVAAFVWLIDVFGIWGNELAERSIMMMFSVFALASPLINFTMLPPYRALLPYSPSQKTTQVTVLQPDFTSAMIG